MLYGPEILYYKILWKNMQLFLNYCLWRVLNYMLRTAYVNLQQKLCTALHFLSEQISAGVEHLILLLLNYLESTVNTSSVLLPGVVLIIGQ